MKLQRKSRAGFRVLPFVGLTSALLPISFGWAGGETTQNKGKQVTDAYGTVLGAVYPVAGAMFKATGEFLDLCGYFSNPDPVGEALKRINARLDALEGRMAAAEAEIERAKVEIFRNANLARIRQLRAHKSKLQSIIFRLQQPTTTKAEKVALAHDAQLVAEEFFIETDQDLWIWSDLALKDHVWLEKPVAAGTILEPEFKPWPTMEYYTLALATWMMAIEASSDRNAEFISQNHGTAIQKHIAFLSLRPNWTPRSGPAQSLPEHVRTQIKGWFTPDKYPDNLVCYFHEYTEDSIAREVKYIQTMNYPAKDANELVSVPAGFWNYPTIAEEELERAYGTGLMWLLADKLSRLQRYGTMQEQFVGTFAAPGRTIVPAFIYGINPEGRMVWYRHDGATEGLGVDQPGAWVGASQQSLGWGDFKQILPGGGNVIHAISKEGKNSWYRHDGFNTGARREWNGAKEVGSGWNGFKHVFSGGNGAFYAITHAGKLLLYRHTGHKDGIKLWENSKEVGSGWGNFKTVFSGGDGIVYAVTYEGKLLWYKHTGFATGAKSWLPAKEIKAKGTENWADYKFVFSAGPRVYGTPTAPRIALDKIVIYAIDNDGKLWWYGHRGYGTGANFLNARREVGRGWGEFTSVFALLPDAADAVR